jgi:alpha-tubulin suppressor-like RCC1 family protein
MNPICKTILCDTIRTNVGNTTITDPVNCMIENAIAADRMGVNRCVVMSPDDLPDLNSSNIPNGQIVFLGGAYGVPLIASCCEWIGLDGRKKLYVGVNLWAWGFNGSGPLGDNTTTARSSPVREITSSTNWCQVSAGCFHTSALKTDGSLWTWGNGACGRLGDNTTTARSSPVREITSSTNWCQVSAGGYHTSALKTDGSLWAWGLNTCGRLGDNTNTTRSSPVREITSSTNWCQVSAGCFHTSALKTDGSLWAWGSNNLGRLGDNTATDRSSPVREITSSTNWCQVSAGGYHTGAIKTDGSLWAWGFNGSGRLGDNTTTSRSSPVREITSSTNWCQVSAGCTHTSALKTDGSLWAWGNNGSGRLGDNTATARSSPVQEITSSTNWCQVSAGYHTSALKTDGSLWSWGNNGSGRLGDNTATARSSPVREITSSTNWCQVSAGTAHTSALKGICIFDI